MTSEARSRICHELPYGSLEMLALDNQQSHCKAVQVAWGVANVERNPGP